MVPPPPCGCGAPPYAPCSSSVAATYPPTPFPGGYAPFPFPSTASYQHPCPFGFYPTYAYAPPAPVYPPLPNGFGAPSMDPFGACTTSLVGAPASDFFPAAANPSTPSSPTPIWDHPQPQSCHTLELRPPWYLSSPEAYTHGQPITSPPSPMSEASGLIELPNHDTPDPRSAQPAPSDLTSIPTPGYYSSTSSYDSSCQMREASQIPTHVDPTPIHGDHHHHHSSPECHAATRVGSSAAPLLELPGANSPVLMEMEPVLTTSTAQQNPSSVSLVAPTPGLFSATTGPTTKPSAETQARAKASISKNMPSVLRDMNRQLDEHQIQSRRSIASLQSELSKLVDMASSLNNSMEKVISMVPLSRSRTMTSPTPSVGFTPSSVSTTMDECATAVFSNTAAPAYVAPQMFGEMPTPRSEYENYSSGNPNPIQSSVHGESTNFSEQNLDGRPQSYGFHNLNRQGVFLADGIERSYFTLPADYPLERAVPEPVFPISDGESNGCSIESVQVFAEEKQHESRQLVKCFGKAQEIEQKAACLNYISDDFDLTLELQQQDDERASNCLVWKASVSFITRSSQLSIEHTMRELRLLWDPGSLKSIMDAPALVKFSSLEGLAHAVIFSPNILLPMSVYAATSIPNILVSLPLYILWDTGDTKYHAMFTTAAGATKFQCVDICKPTMVQKLDVHFRARSESILESAIMSSCAFGLGRTEVNAHQLRDPPLKVLVTPERRKEWDPGEHTFRSSTQNREIVSVLQTSILTQETTNRPTQCISLKYLLQSAEIKYPCILSYFFLLRYTNVKCNCWLITVLQSIDDQVKCLNPLSLTTPWDPGVLVILHSCTATHPIVTHPGAFAHVPQSIFASTECYYVFCLGGTEVKTTTVLVLVIPCSKGKSVSMHSLCSCQMVTIAGQTITFQSCATKSVQVTKNKHPREFLMAEMLLIVSEFRDGQLTYMPQSPTINSSEFERHMVTVLSCWLSSLENRAKLQWDPGIAISSYMLKWLKMRAVKTLPWLQKPLLNDVECQSAMSNTSCVWYPGMEALCFSCNRLIITVLIQMNGWTSMTYSSISLSEYPYVLTFLHDQWEFARQQGVHEKQGVHETDSAKHSLLSLQKYLQNREMDIFFATFLPP